MDQKEYQAYALHSFHKMPQYNYLTEEQKFNIRVVGNVLPFKVNNYVLDELIDWSDVENDPMFQLTFPQKGMLSKPHFNKVASMVEAGMDKYAMRDEINKIRQELNPHPAGQQSSNVPEIDGVKLTGVQHKYRETMLFFPRKGQTCHAYCTFCFRWPQFVGMDDLKFAMNETSLIIKYIKANPHITDILITGGDPMIMAPEVFATYLNALLDADLPNLQNIRIGSKSLTFWPYKYTTDKGADKFLKLFEKATKAGKHLTFMAHFNNPVEISTSTVKKAIQNIRNTGAQIRTQAPIMKYINDDADAWATMWKEQVKLGCVPYYMFIARDTGAQDYFAVNLERCWQIYREAYQKVSGIARTVRGPSMSASPGKVQVLGTQEIHGEKVFVLNFLQGRNPDWVGRPFFAKYDPHAIWLDELEPAFGEEKFFFEKAKKSQKISSTELSYN